MELAKTRKIKREILRVKVCVCVCVCVWVREREKKEVESGRIYFVKDINYP